MAVPVLTGTSQYTAITDVTAIPLAVPGGAGVGDTLIVVLNLRGAGQTATGPAGWTSVVTVAAGTTHVLAVFYKVAVSGDLGSTPNFTASIATNHLGQMLSFSGTDGAAPTLLSSVNKSTAGTTHTNAAGTTTVADTLLVSTVTARYTSNVGAGITWDRGTTALETYSWRSPTALGLDTATLGQASPGSSGAFVATLLASVVSAGALFTLAPAGDPTTATAAAVGSAAAPAGGVGASITGVSSSATATAPAGTAAATAGAVVVAGVLATATAAAPAGAAVSVTYLDIELSADLLLTADLSLAVDIEPAAPVTGELRIGLSNSTWSLPDLDANGQVDPDSWELVSASTPGNMAFGRIQVILGGVDVTVLRGIPTIVESYSNGEPFGDMTAVLRFPGISPFEGAGALSTTGLTMFAGNPDVTLRRIRQDGTVDPTAQPLWQGLLASDDDSVDDGSWSGLVVQCMGALYQASLQMHKPGFELNARDIGTVIPEIFNSTLGRRFATMARVDTGIMTRKRGSWGPKTDFAQELLSDAVTEDGEQWTVQLLNGRKPVLVLKDMDTFHYTITTGTPGLRISMQRDRTQATNVVYGEGVAQDQCRWRNTRYPANGRAFFQPLAELSSTQPYLYDVDGNITGPNPTFDPRVIRVERWEQFGEGIQPGQGVTSAQGEISRANQVDFSGTLTLATDPESGSRFQMRAGQNIVLKQYRGGNRVLHISKVDVNVQSQTVTLTVDSQARDLVTLAQVRLRNRDATDPARALVGRRSQSRIQQDQRAVWDCENGAGTVPETELVAGWNVIEVPAGQAGGIVRTEITTSPATRSSVAAFGRPVSRASMNRLAPTPLTAVGDGGSIYDTNADALDEAGFLIGFGGPDNACGYYPGTDPDSGAPGSHTLTGKMLDDGGWEYSTVRPPTIWLAVWVTADCTVTGRLYQSVNGG